MAHFAKLDSDNNVIQVVVVDNEDLREEDGNESEQKGIEFLMEVTGYSKWKQTSYNASIRKNYAGIGFKYDENLDCFIPPKPYDSWIFDDKTVTWIPSIPYPTDGEDYVWIEETKSWEKTKELYSN